MQNFVTDSGKRPSGSNFWLSDVWHRLFWLLFLYPVPRKVYLWSVVQLLGDDILIIAWVIAAHMLDMSFSLPPRRLYFHSCLLVCLFFCLQKKRCCIKRADAGILSKGHCEASVGGVECSLASAILFDQDSNLCFKQSRKFNGCPYKCKNIKNAICDAASFIEQQKHNGPLAFHLRCR